MQEKNNGNLQNAPMVSGNEGSTQQQTGCVEDFTRDVNKEELAQAFGPKSNKNGWRYDYRLTPEVCVLLICCLFF